MSGKPHPTKPLSHIFESKSTPNRKENKSYWCIRQNKSHVIQNQSSSLLLAHWQWNKSNIIKTDNSTISKSLSALLLRPPPLRPLGQTQCRFQKKRRTLLKPPSHMLTLLPNPAPWSKILALFWIPSIQPQRHCWEGELLLWSFPLLDWGRRALQLQDPKCRIRRRRDPTSLSQLATHCQGKAWHRPLLPSKPSRGGQRRIFARFTCSSLPG